jgi:hypothetical protein
VRDVQLVPRQADVDVEAVTISGLVVMSGSLDHDVTRDHPVEEAVESSGSIAKVGRERVRVIHASERELKRCLHLEECLALGRRKNRASTFGSLRSRTGTRGAELAPRVAARRFVRRTFNDTRGHLAMIQSTHYAALGLENHDRESVIRGAFRDLERRYHPGRVGPGGAQNFRAISDAYRVLSEASLRRSYDEARLREAEEPLALPPSPSPAVGLRVAPVVTFSLRAAPTPISSAREAMLARFARNFSGLGVPKSEMAECLHVRLFIAPPAHGEGVVIRLDLPVLVRCEACAGHRAVALPQCRACDGQGFTASERSVAMFITGKSPDGTTREVSLVPLGIYNFYLHAAVQLVPS